MDRFLTVNFVAPLRRLLNGHDTRQRIPILMYHAITDDSEPGVRGYYRLNTPPALFRRHLQILKEEGFTVVDLPTAIQHLSNGAQSPSALSSEYSAIRDPQSAIEPSSGSAVIRPQSSVLSHPPAGESAFPAPQPALEPSSEPSALDLPLRAGERAGARCSDHGSALGPPSSVFRPPIPRFAVITFDDGYSDFAEHAAPALAEFGFAATNFIISGSAGKKFKDRECLTWREMRELQTAGFSFGSHTVSHPRLWELDDRDLRRELFESRTTIEDNLGIPIDTFAHPFAFPRTDTNYLRRFSAVLREGGYRAGVTTSLGCAGPGDDVLTLKRLPANGADDEALFQAKLLGAYDWLAVPQAVFKRLKQLRAP